MMMSMFSSVSGLKAHQTRMDVIGNNIANVNTVGFKASRTTFQEIFSQTLSSGGAPDAATGRGGTNPMQIGLGMNVDAIDVQMERGSVQRTESPTDLSIEGEGYFVVRGGNSGAFNFTRAGNFTIDKAGNLVTSTGQNVYGWMKYGYGNDGYVFDTEEDIKPLNLYNDEYNMNKRIIAAKATTEAVLAGNLDATKTALYAGSGDYDDLKTGLVDTVVSPATTGDGIPDNGASPPVKIEPDFIVPLNVYDDLGNEYKVNLQMWKFKVCTESGQPQTSWYWRLDGGTASASATGYIKFDSKGKLIANSGDFPVKETIELRPNANSGAGPFSFELNLEQLSQYADDSSVKPTRIDGYPPGTLVTFSIGGDGVITGVYDNGKQQPLGLLSLATFENPAGLQKVGSNQFIQTPNSGNFQLPHKPGSDGAGVLIPGTLEMSNVDLAKQFTEMIITQRGFQANSRVMTTSDEILQELASMKR